MINIYCSNKLSKLFRLPKLNYSPETTEHHWIAHLINLDDMDCIAFMDTKTFYSVIIFDVEINENLIFKDQFVENFLIQLKNDKVEMDDRTSIENACDVFNVHSSANDQRTMAILKNVINKLKFTFDKEKNISDSKYYVKRNLNAIPWKINGFQGAKDLMQLEIRNYW